MKKTAIFILASFLAAVLLGGVIGYAASSHQPFVDVPVGAWYEKAVAWAYECGVTNGVVRSAGGRKMTNAEKIRSMTDEELGEFIGMMVDHDFCFESGCKIKREGCCRYPYLCCDENALAWLRQEV